MQTANALHSTPSPLLRPGRDAATCPAVAIFIVTGVVYYIQNDAIHHLAPSALAQTAV